MKVALTAEQFDALRTLLSQAAGLVFDDSRKESMAYSVAERLRETGLPDVASYAMRPGDRVEVRESRRNREAFKVIKETLKGHQAPEWLSLDPAKLSGSVSTVPRRDQMPLDLSEQLVVEYYSR